MATSSSRERCALDEGTKRHSLRAISSLDGKDVAQVLTFADSPDEVSVDVSGDFLGVCDLS